MIDPSFHQTEEAWLARLAIAIDMAFLEPDLYMREIFLSLLMRNKWKRAAILQSGVSVA